MTSLIEKFIWWHELDDIVSRRIRIRDEKIKKLSAKLAAIEAIHLAVEKVELVELVLYAYARWSHS